MFRQDQVDCIRALENRGFITAAQARDALTRPGGEAALDSRINELREWIYSQTKPTGPVFDKNMTEKDAEMLRLEMERLKSSGAAGEYARNHTYGAYSAAVGAIQRVAAGKTAPSFAQQLHEEHADTVQRIINDQRETIKLLRSKVERMELAGKAWELDLAYMVDHARSVLNHHNDHAPDDSPRTVVSILCDEVRRLRGIIADMGARGGKRGAVVCCQNDEEDA